MKTSLLDILACPDCGSPLKLSVFEEFSGGGNDVREGLLLCEGCSEIHPVIEGIPRFVPNVFLRHPDFAKKYPQVAGASDEGTRRAFLKAHGSTHERVGVEWMNYPGPLPEDREVFLAETQVPAGDWKGKRVLDAGCGMGRYSRVAHELGAETVALDLSHALERLSDLARSSGRLHLVQGNLLSPPFRDKVFDIVYSVGVIHHTPSAREAFRKISRLARSGGTLSVWVYGAAGKFSDFRTNPLRPGRAGLKPVIFWVWLTVKIREFLSDVLRLFTVRIPGKLLYLLCYPLAFLGAVPGIRYLTFSAHPLWRVRLQENFDWLTPPYQSHHSKEELGRWFEEEGCEVVKVLPHGFVPKPGILGRKK